MLKHVAPVSDWGTAWYRYRGKIRHAPRAFRKQPVTPKPVLFHSHRAQEFGTPHATPHRAPAPVREVQP